MVLEAAIQRYIRENLDKIPNSFWVKPTTTNKNGTPDILGCYKGNFIAIELKRAKHIAPNALQKYRINQINDAGGIAFWAASWQEVKKKLNL